MRVLQISSAKDFGGGERHVVDLSRGLQELGHEVFAAVRPTCSWREKLDFLPPENILQVSLRNSFGVLSAIRIGDFVRENNIDIVHAHVARDYVPASIACMTAKRSKFVFTRHVMLPLKPFNRFALKNIAAAIGVSAAAARELKKMFDPRRVHVINNGIDLQTGNFRSFDVYGNDFRQKHNIPKDALLIGTLGELKELKGQRDFLLAARQISDTLPDVRFVIVGVDRSSDQLFSRELRRLSNVFRLEEKFVWLDWLDDTSPFYSAIDVFVSPSHSESFGIAILEAMVHGKPVAATATDGANELLGDIGRLVPTESPVELANELIKLLKDPEQMKTNGEKARAKAVEYYSLERMVNETVGVYSNIIESVPNKNL